MCQIQIRYGCGTSVNPSKPFTNGASTFFLYQLLLPLAWIVQSVRKRSPKEKPWITISMKNTARIGPGYSAACAPRALSTWNIVNSTSEINTNHRATSAQFADAKNSSDKTIYDDTCESVPNRTHLYRGRPKNHRWYLYNYTLMSKVPRLWMKQNFKR